MKPLNIIYKAALLLLIIVPCARCYTPQQHRDHKLIRHKPGDSTLVTGWYFIVDSGKGVKRQLFRSKESYYLDPTPILTSDYIEKVDLLNTGEQDPHQSLRIWFDEDGKQMWSKATLSYIDKRIAFVIDNLLFSTDWVSGQITTGISTMDTPCSLKELVSFKEKLEQESKSP